MIICSGLYYLGSLARGDLIIRDNRFYPCKYIETFPVWLQYLRKYYVGEHIVLFLDRSSPISIQPLLDAFPEAYDIFENEIPPIHRSSDGPLVHIKWLDQYSGEYFRPMQRNLVQAIIAAYNVNESLFWLDNDAFLNTDVRPLIGDADVAAPNIAHHQMTMDSVCTYISSARLHKLEEIEIDLRIYLKQMLLDAPKETRMHALQEGGLYKTFCYGNMRQISSINLCHLSCYPRFMRFLDKNPLDTPEYRTLVNVLKEFNLIRIPKEAMVFQDMLHSEIEGVIL